MYEDEICMKKKIAIVGMGAILPDAMDLSEYWSNILAAKDSIKDISDTYWNIKDFYDPDPTARDKSYSYKAAEVNSIQFDSIGFGIPPKVMESISVEQLYALVVAKQALLDADLIGNNAKAFNREKAGVIMAATVGKTAFGLSRRQDIPQMKKIFKNSGLSDEIIERIVERLLNAEIEWTESSEPGFLANVVAGRIANRFDFNGTNCAVDAACASSIAALRVAVNELQSGDCDVVLTGGVNLDLTSTAFISFCKTPAISKSSKSRPFDADADGMILGDGVAMVVLKRLEDAKRDKDRIYAVINAVGSSGDGRATSIFAPNKEGQLKALHRAYEKTEITPATVSLIEAHGTGTHVGDAIEVSALTQFFNKYDVKKNSVAIGSVKSQIGHSRLTAGMSSLIKAALSIYHQTLPPTINVKKDRADILDSPFYTLSKPQPWLTSKRHPIRRAGVSSFGFGGTNFHVVLEEYVSSKEVNEKGETPLEDSRRLKWRRTHRIPVGICLDAPTQEELMVQCENLVEQIGLDKVAYDQLLDGQQELKGIPLNNFRVGFVSKDAEDATEKLCNIVSTLKGNSAPDKTTLEKEGIYFRENSLLTKANVATLFPGQGSQYLGMFNEIARDYPEMSNFLSLVGEELESEELQPIADVLYGAGKKMPQKDAEDALRNTKYTQPALAAICGGLYEIIRNRGYEEEVIIGHSFGELTGLWAAEALEAETFVSLTTSRGKLMSEGTNNTGMISIAADVNSCEEWLKDYKNLYVANENSNEQTVVSGDMKQIERLSAMLKELKVSSTILKVSQGFHSPYMEEASHDFSSILESAKFSSLKKRLYNGAKGIPYESKADLVKNTFKKQMTSSVRFAKSVEDAYEKGVKVFVEIGPGKILTNLTHKILEGKEHYVIAFDGLGKQKSAHEQLEEALVRLKVLGMKLSNDIYRKTSAELYKSDKPRTSYLINPMGYITPEKRQLMEEAVERIDPIVNLASETGKPMTETSLRNGNPVTVERETAVLDKIGEEVELQDIYNQEGELYVSKESLGSVLGLQTSSTKALEEFLTSQGKQIEVFKELFKEASDGKGTENAVRFIEIFQNNSLRAFEAYMKGQQMALNRVDSSLESSAFTNRPQPTLSLSEAFIQQDVGNEISVDSLEGKTPPSPLPSTENEPFIASAKEEEVDASATLERVANEIVSDDFDPVQIMIEVISEKSGYPEELIDADMNIEADLGIDSIKRIEIFAEIGKKIPGEIEQDDIEAISMLQTIQEVGDYIKKKKIASVPDESKQRIKRFEVILDELPPAESQTQIPSSGLIIIHGDQDGVALGLARQLLDLGYQIAMIVSEKMVLPKLANVSVYPLTTIDDNGIANLFEKIAVEENQLLAGFIHVGSKGKEYTKDIYPFAKDEIGVLKTIFLCAKYFVQAKRQENSFFVSAVRMDGGLGLLSGENILQGGLFGLHKSLAIEWEEEMVTKAVDLDTTLTPEVASKYLLDEIFNKGYHNIEVGRDYDGRRLAPKLVEKYVKDLHKKELRITSKDTFLVTGGGRGITASCVTQLAKTTGCGFILLGRTDIATDISWAKGEQDHATLKNLALAQFAKRNPQVKPKPTDIDELVGVALNQMEILDTLEAIKEAGGRVIYESCDVRDVTGLKALIEKHEKGIGTVTGLIHGAGTIADKKIQRKTAADFNSVFGSKVEGLDACLNALKLDKLKMMILFSSVAGFFGNGGQSDYAMANEVLNKFAFFFNKNHSTCKTVAMNWGAWDGGSMVDESIRNIVKDTELSLIPPEVGVTYFMEQFYHHDNPSQLVINCADHLIRPKVNHLTNLI